VPGVLQRLLTRSGILPILRSQWRADQSAAAEKLETRLDKRLALLKEQVDRVEALAQKLEGLETLGDSAERLKSISHEVRVMRATMMLDIQDRNTGPHRPGVYDDQRVAAHVERAIATARVEADPSVHIVIDNLVPPETYEAILDGIPPRVFFSQRDDEKQNLKLSMLDIAPAWTFETLAFVENTLIPRMMVPALLRKFQPHIHEFYLREYGSEQGPALATLPHAATGGRLMLRRPGYHLDPHLDPKRVVFTCLLYFARPGDSEGFGTTFYRMSGTPKIDRTSTFYPGTQGIRCDLVKMVPFRQNSAVAFLNWGGAHGADIPRDAPKNTERYSYQFYVSPDPAAVAAILGEPASVVAE
jgi:hypothetical protein